MMKKILRILSFILVVCIMTCSLTSCSVTDGKRLLKKLLIRSGILVELSEESAAALSDQPTISTDDSTTESGEQTPDQSASDLEYSLSDADISGYYEILKACEAAFLDAESTEEDLSRIEDQFVDSYYHIVTQSQIAYLWYCMDTGDRGRAEDYLFSTEAAANAYDAYMQLCKRMDVCQSPWRDRFFEGWSAAEFEEMRGFSGEVTELGKANDLLVVQYRQLTDENFYDGAADYYVQLVENNNRIAELKGYDNYWLYAYEEEYRRDYGKSEIQQMREYVCEYLVPLCDQARVAFNTQYAALSPSDRAFVAALLEKADYNDFSVDYMGEYLSTFEEEQAADMRGLLETGNSFFADSANAYRGAYTTYLYSLDRPVCYFGPGYQGMDTVIHELGHYYAYLVNENEAIHLDLAEVQSQGNEWLFWAYMDTVLPEDVANAVYAYCLYDSLGTVIIGAAIDEFEQICYEREIDSSEEADAVMADVKARYGGEVWLSENLTDLDHYWRHVTLEQSVYYVSYSVSMLAAMQIYSVAKSQSYDAARELYLSLTDPVSSSLMECLTSAGLRTPMEEALYLELNGLI